MIVSLARKLPAARWSARDWGVLILTAMLIASLPLGLGAARWLRSDGLLWGAAAGGGLVGMLLALRMRRGWIATSLIAVVGAAVVVQAQSGVLPRLEPAVAELGALARWAGTESAAWVIDAVTPAEDGTLQVVHPATQSPAMPEWQAAAERLSLYGWNLSAGLPTKLEPGRWSSGQTALALALGLLTWVISGHTAWRVSRHASVWLPLLAVTAILSASIHLSSEGWAVLLIAASVGLLLVGAASLHEIERRWPPDALYDWLWHEWWAWAAVASTLVVLAMGVAVALTDPDLQQGVDRLVPSVNVIPSARGSRGAEQQVRGVLPRQHLLNSGPDLSQQPVMTVRTPDAPLGGFYWRAGSYDSYTGHGWVRHTASRDQSGASPLWPQDVTAPPGSVTLRQTFRLNFDTRTIYAAGRPVRLTEGATGIWRDSSGFDLTGVETLIAIRAYEALSWVPAATPDELRAAQGGYPEWVSDVYLALPEEVPPRVADLAREITSDAPTAYDKAIALQDTLRAYPYSLDLPDPPRDHDVVDYFLFDLKRGYCDYYASAMAVMARSIGLPARLVVGYRTGTYDAEADSYYVTQADAHSWVEIYFPSYGWIPFEPTGGVPRIEHGLSQNWRITALPEPAATPQWNTAPDVRRQTIRIPEYILWLAGGGLGLILLLAARPFVLRSIQQRRWRSLNPDQAALALYGALRGEAYRLGAPLAEWQTPHEMIPVLMDTLAIRARRAPHWSGDWSTRLPEIRRGAEELITLYAGSVYSPHPPREDAVRRTLDAWPGLARSLRTFRWIGWLAGIRLRR